MRLQCLQFCLLHSFFVYLACGFSLTPDPSMPSSPVCQFGNRRYGLEEEWRPDLGPPFGVLYCVRCQCVPIQRKHRIATRVRCKNFKNECPEPKCDKPVLLPEHCCKTCPGEADYSYPWKNGKEKEKDEKKSSKGSFDVPVNMVKKNQKKLPIRGSSILPTPSFKNSSKKANGQVKSIDKEYMEDGGLNSLHTDGSHRCYYEGEKVEDGSQWKSQFDNCQMCSCQRGRVKCEQIMCPTSSCVKPTFIPGECCPTCLGDTGVLAINGSKPRGCYFEGDKQFHLAGSQWHPYIPPFGFDRCSLCTCSMDSLLIECGRNVVCPTLPCPEYEAFREKPMDCCKRCPNTPMPVKSIKMSKDQLGDQRASTGGWIKSPNEILAGGGCSFKGKVYANGDEWHPTIQPFGEVKCVKCHCKNRRVRCRRTKCPRLSCPIKINKADECCPKCAGEEGEGFMAHSDPFHQYRSKHHHRYRNRKRRKRRRHRKMG